jgi:hypothetical protein
MGDRSFVLAEGQCYRYLDIDFAILQLSVGHGKYVIHGSLHGFRLTKGCFWPSGGTAGSVDWNFEPPNSSPQLADSTNSQQPPPLDPSRQLVIHVCSIRAELAGLFAASAESQQLQASNLEQKEDSASTVLSRNKRRRPPKAAIVILSVWYT